MDLYEKCGVAAGILSAIAFVPYVISILRGKTKPSRVTWFVWLLVGIILYGSYKALGATHSSWVTLSYVVGPFVVVCLSIRYGVGGWAKLDIICLCGALLGALLWWWFNSPLTALVMNVTMDCFGLLPTLNKSWQKPKEEDRLAWTISMTSAAINLFALNEWTFELSAYPLYMLAGNGSVCVILWWKWFAEWRKRFAARKQ